MRTPLLAANWKMHKTVLDAVGYVRELGVLLKNVEGVEVVVAPPFTALAAAAEAARNTDLEVAAQDVYFEAQGAFTGEVSAVMIKDAGADYCIVGHSERRRLFGDTDEWVNRKIRPRSAPASASLPASARRSRSVKPGTRWPILDRQLRAGLAGLTTSDVASLVVAYEPVWAIGTGRNATPAEADEAHRHIRERLTEMFGAEAALKCRLLYGGSVKPDNIAELIALADVDGALVGGASLDVTTFFDIVKHAI